MQNNFKRDFSVKIYKRESKKTSRAVYINTFSKKYTSNSNTCKIYEMNYRNIVITY